MQSTSIVIAVLSMGAVAIACATGGDPATTGGDDGSDVDSGSGLMGGDDTSPVTTPDASRPGPKDGGPAVGLGNDSGTTTGGKDSGSMTTQKDSGSTMMTGGGGGDCTGTMSTANPGATYEQECESANDEYDCVPGGHDCDQYNDPGGTFYACCYTEKKTSLCAAFNGGNPQCVVQ